MLRRPPEHAVSVVAEVPHGRHSGPGVSEQGLPDHGLAFFRRPIRISPQRSVLPVGDQMHMRVDQPGQQRAPLVPAFRETLRNCRLARAYGEDARSLGEHRDALQKKALPVEGQGGEVSDAVGGWHVLILRRAGRIGQEAHDGIKVTHGDREDSVSDLAINLAASVLFGGALWLLGVLGQYRRRARLRQFFGLASGDRAAVIVGKDMWGREHSVSRGDVARSSRSR